MFHSARVLRPWILVLIVSGIHARATAQETDPAGTESTPSASAGSETTDGEAPATKPSGQVVERPIGPQLFPFYQHYERQPEGTTIRNILYLFTTTRNEDDWSLLLLPFFYRAHEESPPSERLNLFPLLYLGKRSEAESYDYWLPLYFGRRSDHSTFHLLAPLWLRRSAESGKFVQHDVPPLFPFYRYTHDERDPDDPFRSHRFGLFRMLDLYESRRGPETYDFRAFNFFNFGETAQGGLPFYKYSWVRYGDQWRGKTHLFPLYWHAREPDSQYRFVVPLYWHSESPDGGYRVIVPFYGRFESGDSRHDVLFPFYWTGDAPGKDSLFLFPLLSGFSSGPGDTRGLSVLFPLFNFTTGSDRFTFWSFPLGYYHRTPREFSLFTIPFDISRSENGSGLGVFLLLYRTRFTNETGKRTHAVLPPLVFYDVEPDGSEGRIGAFPYYELYDLERRWRWVIPLYLERQTLAGGQLDSYWQLGLPLYYSWGQAENYFSMGIPLYWAHRNGARGWRVFLPLFYQSYAATAEEFHLIPLYSRRKYPSRDQRFFGGPLYIYEKNFDIDRNVVSTGHYPLWPFFGFASGSAGYHYRVLPLFWTSRKGETRDLLLTPLYYRQWGPEGSSHYFFPFYGRFKEGPITKDYYALGAFTRTTVSTSTGSTRASQNDVLWKLISHSSDRENQSSHTHVLPLLFWNTDSPGYQQTIAGPLYYGHRIVEDDEEHRLNLVLGNVYLSKVVEDVSREIVVQDDAGELENLSPVERGEVHGPPAPDEATPIPAGPPEPIERRELRSRERGFLYPLTRSYEYPTREAKGKWAIPFYYDLEDRFGSNFALWPLYFSQKDNQDYSPTFYRYAFLFNREHWETGSRHTIGQILFDWHTDSKRDYLRWRFLYPLLEHESSVEGWNLDILDPFIHAESTESRGERVVSSRVFPIFWQGSRERQTAVGEWQPEEKHLFVLPIFGSHTRSTRSDYYVLFPFFHLLSSEEALNWELWPMVFRRSEPGLRAFRVWPLHADESGESAGDFWVSRYLYLSKRFQDSRESTYRLDPLLFEWRRSEDELQTKALFNVFSYERKPEERSYHLLPLVFGKRTPLGAHASWIPFYHGRDFGPSSIDPEYFWHYFFPLGRLRGGDGERRATVFGKIFEYARNPERPEFRETRVLQWLYLNRTTSFSRQLMLGPIFSYYRNDEDEEVQFSCLLSLYRYSRLAGEPTHTLFYFIRF